MNSSMYTVQWDMNYGGLPVYPVGDFHCMHMHTMDMDTTCNYMLATRHADMLKHKLYIYIYNLLDGEGAFLQNCDTRCIHKLDDEEFLLESWCTLCMIRTHRRTMSDSTVLCNEPQKRLNTGSYDVPEALDGVVRQQIQFSIVEM